MKTMSWRIRRARIPFPCRSSRRLRSERPPPWRSPRTRSLRINANTAAACYPRIARRASARTAGSRVKETCGARAAATSWTWAGPTACRAAVLQGLSEAPHRGNCRRRYRARGDRSRDPDSRPGSRTTQLQSYVGTPAVFRRSLSQDERDFARRRVSASARRRRRDLPWRARGPARARQRARARHPARPEVQARSVRQFPSGTAAASRPLAAARPGVDRLRHFPREYRGPIPRPRSRSEEHTSELQSRRDLVCRLLLEKKKNSHIPYHLTKAKKKHKKT